MKIIKIFLLILIMFTILAFIFITYHLQSHAIVTIDEIVPKDEAQQIQRAADNFIEIIKQTQVNYAARGAHAKGHACVKAYFDIHENIAPHLQYGIFLQAGKRYKSWIRFSNGSSNMAKNDDREKDSRGMAIKLLSINNTENDVITQDFLAHNSPAFFSTDLKDYNQLVESDDKIAYFFPSYNPFSWRLRELSHVMDTLSPPPYSPLSDEYFSNTAYKLGDHNIKFMIKPCSVTVNQHAFDLDDPDFLSNILALELAENSACMQFYIQLQDPSKIMPIEDPSVLWKEDDSSFIPVATLSILKQQFNSPEQKQFCENLSFSPWNSLTQHRPIGALNRVRKFVYKASSDYRHKQNQTKVPINLAW